MTAQQLVPRRWLKQADLWIVLLMFVAIGIGWTALGSIAVNGMPSFLKRQVLLSAIGLVGFVLAALVDCERVGRLSKYLYGLNLGLLIAVLLFGHETKGSVRWFGTETLRFQPSEFAKLFTVVTLATFLAARRDRLQSPRVFLHSLLHIAVPVLLILRQPDLGTGLAIVAIWFGMVFIAGMRWQHLALFAIVGLLLFGVMWRLGLIHDYQVQRIVAVARPDSDPQGSGYQVRQARIAIGSGRVLGKGFGRGTQAHRKFIPERQTDFIFTIVAEEGGFAASVAVVAIYALLLFRGWFVVASTDDMMSRLVGTGVLSMLGFHAFVNLGMTMGILPVTGVPLPFVSYGGSSMIVSMTSIGLLVGISGRREPLVF